MACVLAALGLYLYLIELPEQRHDETTASQAKRILPFNEAEITTLTVRSQSGEVVLTQSPGQAWTISQPIHTDADQRQVQALLRALVTGSVSRLVEAHPVSLTPFGLDHASTVVTVGSGTRQETLSIGDAGPLSSSLYVLRASDQAVLLTDLAPKDFLNKTLLSFRRKELLQFAQQDVERLRLTYPTTEIVLYALDEKPKKKWKIRYPIEAEGDRTQVQALLFRLEDLKALAIVDPGPERDKLAPLLTKPKSQNYPACRRSRPSHAALSAGPRQRGGLCPDDTGRPDLQSQSLGHQGSHEGPLHAAGQTVARRGHRRYRHVVGQDTRRAIHAHSSA